MSARALTTIILAAGEGTRMKSARAKVLHEIAGRSMLGHVIAAAIAAGSARIAVVVGPDREDARAAARALAPDVLLFEQRERLGTAHAALAAREALAAATDDVVIVFGDTPLLTGDSLARLRAPLANGAAIVVGAFEAANPKGYGRVLTEAGRVVAIREERDASESERRVTLCNGGMMAIRADRALALLDRVGNANAKGEYYLTDIVALARGGGQTVDVVAIDEEEVQGVNDRAQLASAEAALQQRLRARALAGGVTMVDPATVYLAHDTALAPDTWIGPNVVFGPGVAVTGPGTEIHAFSHLAGCRIAGGVRIGPFARIRPKSEIGEGVHVGNFVEVNRTRMAAKAEANHLAYLGDASIGEGTNIGAGTITCNFNGADKHATTIGRDVFVGSNATLVAPLVIGDETLIAAGSTITKDVAAGGLTFGRARQETLPEKGRARIRSNKRKRAERKAREKS
jgi:bifunctional UDP-N-acetylglucosamine pyrophosphorylase/glucosamine-1-phosphate N-acetyltransferase